MAWQQQQYNPFEEFETDWQRTQKAERGSSPGRLPPGVYHVIVVPQDVDGSGTLVDHEVITANSGTKGFKIYLEILEPETMPNPTTGEQVRVKGEVIDHVFWITQKNLPYIKRDMATILGRDLQSLGEATKISWAGHTVEIGLKDDSYQGFLRSKISFFNPWRPAPKAQPPKRENGGGRSASAPPKNAPAAAEPGPDF